MTAAAPLRPRVLLTVGDPNGIGPEVAVKAAAALTDEPDLAPVVVGDHEVVEPHAVRAGLRIRHTDGSAEPRSGVLDLLPVAALPPGEFLPGTVSAEAGAATVAYLAAAVDAAARGRGRAIVACPHSETAVNAAGIPFDGYPGLLAELSGVTRDRVFLMLVGGGLRIVHATLHERLGDALDRLTPDLVEAAARAAADFLAAAGVLAPRIGVCGINPHAGEGGLFGDDDERVTAPAVAALRRDGIDATGPLGADLLLGPDRRDGFDAFVAMYHDQGHIPVKLLAGRTAAALSIGAGLAFSSVGHGAAFDIAGRGVADPEAVLRAVRLVGGVRAPQPVEVS
ncbi:PdxA family dehydrogenase [Pseudonocardia bannensis]|uniref:Terephthalate dihydrodiol dehydrogenase n=1 Tax=Pseudonocardia bannensis TaxID=630973 RepID=A0A848DDR3_9PSEU|nr:4-hydroxythreonine-4-phosphate dehydrogenase PdxA [Pseudonocardia bannensis]NMH90734.1 terephthalate dihydrodiol dehydrogenase [Pseudonocardia bannensis]